MLGRILAVILVFAGLSGLAMLALVALHGNSKKPAVTSIAAPVAKVKIVVAARDVPGGTLLRPTDLASRSVTQADVPVDFIRDDDAARKMLAGALLRISVSAGGLISSEAVVKPGDHGYLSAILRSGQTAVSINVDAVTGLSGLIWPGDIVNLIVTHELDADGEKPLVAETLLSGLRVIAVDQDLEHGKSPGGNSRDTRTITLEVTPKDAEIVNIASQMGRLSVALRAMSDGDHAAPPHATLAKDISPAMQLMLARPHIEAKASVHVFNGASEGP